MAVDAQTKNIKNCPVLGNPQASWMKKKVPFFRSISYIDEPLHPVLPKDCFMLRPGGKCYRDLRDVWTHPKLWIEISSISVSYSVEVWPGIRFYHGSSSKNLPGIDDDSQSTPAYEGRQPRFLASVPSAFHEIMENIVGK